jgi:hypothetical protein
MRSEWPSFPGGGDHIPLGEQLDIIDPNAAIFVAGGRRNPMFCPPAAARSTCPVTPNRSPCRAITLPSGGGSEQREEHGEGTPQHGHDLLRRDVGLRILG